MIGTHIRPTVKAMMGTHIRPTVKAMMGTHIRHTVNCICLLEIRSQETKSNDLVNKNKILYKCSCPIVTRSHKYIHVYNYAE